MRPIPRWLERAILLHRQGACELMILICVGLLLCCGVTAVVVSTLFPSKTGPISTAVLAATSLLASGGIVAGLALFLLPHVFKPATGTKVPPLSGAACPSAPRTFPFPRRMAFLPDWDS